MTEYEFRVLVSLRDVGPVNYTSAMGYRLWPESKKSPQGMALAAGRFLGPLQRSGLVDGYNGWSITASGRLAVGLETFTRDEAGRLKRERSKPEPEY